MRSTFATSHQRSAFLTSYSTFRLKDSFIYFGGRAEVPRRIGSVARALGDATAAIAAWERALVLDGDFAAVRLDLARLLMQRGQWNHAEAQLRAALDTVPTYAAASLELAALLRHTGRPPEAMHLLAELLHRDPYNFAALITLGETMLELGRNADATRAFRRVLTFDPDHVAAILYDGVMLADRRRYRDAIARWARVIELDPAGPYADRARREARTAADLLKVFGEKPGSD